jgi:hypothetical protein
MKSEQVAKALDAAFADEVKTLFHAHVGAGPDDKKARSRFDDGMVKAMRAHDSALASMADRIKDSENFAAESDDDYRVRMMPLAGSEAHRNRIKDAKAADLDALGDHYNLGRIEHPPHPVETKTVEQPRTTTSAVPKATVGPGAAEAPVTKTGHGA